MFFLNKLFEKNIEEFHKIVNQLAFNFVKYDPNLEKIMSILKIVFKKGGVKSYS